MLSFFRTNQQLLNFALLVYAAIFKLGFLVAPSPVVPYTYGVLGQWVDTVGLPAWANIGLAWLLIVLQATLINTIIAQHRMSREPSLFPGVFYILLSAMAAPTHYLSPALLANTFLIIAIGEILNLYRRASSADALFNVGFMTGLASLFAPAYCLFLLLAIVGINITRAFNVRELLMMLLGFIAPHFLTFTYFYWTDQTAHWWVTQWQEGFGFLRIATAWSLWEYALLAAYAIVLAISLFNLDTYNAKQNIGVQKYNTVLTWVMIVSGLVMIVQPDKDLTIVMPLLIPLGIFMGFTFLYWKNKSLATLIHILWVVGTLVLYLQTIFN